MQFYCLRLFENPFELHNAEYASAFEHQSSVFKLPSVIIRPEPNYYIIVLDNKLPFFFYVLSVIKQTGMRTDIVAVVVDLMEMVFVTICGKIPIPMQFLTQYVKKTCVLGYYDPGAIFLDKKDVFSANVASF